MVHNLISYEMIQEEYMDGWIQAAAERGVTEEIVQNLLAMMTD